MLTPDGIEVKVCARVPAPVRLSDAALALSKCHRGADS